MIHLLKSIEANFDYNAGDNGDYTDAGGRFIDNIRDYLN